MDECTGVTNVLEYWIFMRYFLNEYIFSKVYLMSVNTLEFKSSFWVQSSCAGCIYWINHYSTGCWLNLNVRLQLCSCTFEQSESRVESLTTNFYIILFLIFFSLDRFVSVCVGIGLSLVFLNLSNSVCVCLTAYGASAACSRNSTSKLLTKADLLIQPPAHTLKWSICSLSDAIPAFSATNHFYFLTVINYHPG